MSHTRRQFLRTGFSLGALLALDRPARAAGASLPAATRGPRGLLFDAADLPRIRATVQRPEFQLFWTYLSTVDFAADDQFLRHELRLTNHAAHQFRAQGILMRSAFAHVLAPDARHLALARTALQAVLRYPHWDWILNSRQQPVTVMRGAGSCIAVALAADWLAADLTAAELAAIDRGLATVGGPACYRGLDDMTHHDTVPPWSLQPGEEGLPPVDVARWATILNTSNLRIITTAGLAAAACHLHGRHPDAAQWVDLTRDSLQRYAAWQPADSTFGEGIAYWDFTFTHYVFILELLRRRLGIDERGLLDFPAQARYARSMTMPTVGHPDDCINLGDASVAALGVPLAWIAREFRDGAAQAFTQHPHAFPPTWSTSWGAIWFDPELPGRPATAEPLDSHQALGIVLSRSGWGEADSVVSLRSGGPENHEHADRNSVIFKAHGERLLNDPLHAAYATTDPRWLLRLTEAHTAVLIGGRGHVYHDGHDGTNASVARAQLLDFRTGLGWMAATSDAADAYRRAGLPAQVVQRTVVFLKPDVLVLLDRVVLAAAHPVQARFQVHNEDGAGRVRHDGDTFVIERPHATLHAQVTAAGPGRVAAGRLALPEASGVYPYAEFQSDSALAHTFLTVCTAAPHGADHGRLDVTHVGGAWHVAGSHRGQTVRLSLTDPVGPAVPALLI